MSLSTLALSGNSPVWSFEYTSLEFTLTSKQPPPEGMSSREEMPCFSVSSRRAARPTAFGS